MSMLFTDWFFLAKIFFILTRSLNSLTYGYLGAGCSSPRRACLAASHMGGVTGCEMCRLRGCSREYTERHRSIASGISAPTISAILA